MHETQQVSHEQERLYALLDGLEIQVADLDGEGRCRFVNRSFAEQLGQAPADILGRPCRDVLHPETYELLAHPLTQAQAGYATHFGARLRGGNGVLHAYEIRCTPHTPGRSGNGAYLFLEDVTGFQRSLEERHLFEERLAQAQRMEALGTLAGGIAHDFNNILGVVMGYTELSLLKLGPDTPVRAHLEQVVAAADRAKNVVAQILAFSRTTEQQHQPVTLAPLLKEVLKLLRATLPSTIEIVETIDPGTSQVVADPTQLHQVVMNLCTNAYQAMRDRGGRLEVSLHDVPSDASGEASEQNYVQLSVTDTGCGMTPQVRKRVFEPYFTTRPVGEGTGMGLALVHGIATGLGGRVLVESTPGQGSTFRVCLPAWVRPATAATKDKLPRGSGERILLVDDEEALCQLGKEMLGTLGYRATATASSVEALALVRANPQDFDCVITDQTLPRMTGSELLTALLELRPDLPVILCTGHSELIDAAGARRLGAREFLLKPLDLKRMAWAVASALDRQPLDGVR